MRAILESAATRLVQYGCAALVVLVLVGPMPVLSQAPAAWLFEDGSGVVMGLEFCSPGGGCVDA